MGKTKTVVIGADDEQKLTGAEKYKLKQQKKKEEEAKNKGQVKGVGLKGGERIKTIEGGPVIKDEIVEEEQGEVKKSKEPKVRGKNYKSQKSKVDSAKLYSASDAIKLVKDTSYSKFDGTVELHLQVKKKGLNINVDLPYSAGKTKVIEVADAKTLKKLETGKVDFDVLLATPDMMPKLVPFAKLLGPKGLMPNPKSGTVIKTKSDAKKFGGNSVSIKTEKKAPLIHTTIGKVSQKQSELGANLKAVVSAVSTSQIVKAHLSSSMGPSVKLSIS